MNQYLIRAFYLSLLLFIAGCGAVDKPQYIENAKRFLNEGDLKSALIELKNALQQDPENSTARTYLGQLYLKGGDYLAAEKELQKAKELGADDNDVFSSLSQALLRLRKLDAVLAMQTDHLMPREQGEVLASQGIAHMYQGNTKPAVELTERALGKAADSAYVRFARAHVYLNAEESPVLARAQLTRAFEIDKDYASAWSLLGDIEFNGKQPEAAREAYTKSLSLQPANVVDRNKRVTVNILLNDLDKAQDDLDILKKQLPGNPGVAFSQGLAHFAAGKLSEAKSEFDLALLDQDRYPQTLFYLAYVNYRQGNIVQAENHAERYFSLNPEYLPNRKLLAEIKFKKEEYDAVERLLDPVLKTQKADDSVLNLLAKTRLAEGETAEGIALLNRIVERNPDSADARLRLGASLMMSGDQKGGIGQLEMAIQQDEDNHQADIYRILSYLRMRQPEKAHHAAAEFKARTPESEIPYNMVGMIYISERDFEQARKALEESWKIKPGNTDAGHNLATLAIMSGEYDKARNYLDGVIKAHPDNLDSLIKLAELEALEGKPGQLVERLERAIRLYPSAVKPRLVLARYYIRIGKPSQINALIETLDLESRKQLPVMEVMANQAIAQKKYKSAEKLASEIIARSPDTPEGYFILAKAYAGLDKEAQAEETVVKAIQRDEQYLPARIARLHMLVKKLDVPEIEREIAVLKTMVDKNEDVMKAEFILAELKGDQRQALQLAERVFEVFPNIDNMLALSRQRVRSGDSEGALNLKVEWAEEHSSEYDANMVLALTYTQMKQDGLSARYYQRALAASPNDYNVLNNLAWSIRNSNPDQALAYAQKANRLKPGSVELMDTLAMVYLANKSHELALRQIKDALYLQPENPTLRYHEAMINTTTGNNKMAEEILTKLLDKAREFPEKADAEALLEKLKRG
jgi:putative PEP-CTERM system TPR-repeat lipoprotein